MQNHSSLSPCSRSKPASSNFSLSAASNNKNRSSEGILLQAFALSISAEHDSKATGEHWHGFMRQIYAPGCTALAVQMQRSLPGELP